MRIGRNTWFGLAAGLVLAVMGGLSVDGALNTADAQAGFTVSPAQLQINQRISQAAVRRSNRSLNYLAPIRSDATDNADDGSEGVRPLSKIPGAGAGWTAAQIADGAIGTGELADSSVSGAKIRPGAVGTEQLSGDASSGLALWAAVEIAGVAPSFRAERGATSVSPIGPGVYEVRFEVEADRDSCAAFATMRSASPHYANVNISNGAVLVAMYDINDALDAAPFNVSLFCN
jgi:hypothetical protein